MAEGHLRRTEEDAAIIEQRAAETSVELIRASNQLINLEVKTKELSKKSDLMSKVSDGRVAHLLTTLCRGLNCGILSFKVTANVTPNRADNGLRLEFN